MNPLLHASVDLIATEENVFMCSPLRLGQRVLGGGLIASAALAAARSTSAELDLSGMSITFCRQGDSSEPVTLRVHPILESPTTAIHQVSLEQSDIVVASSTVRLASPSTISRTDPSDEWDWSAVDIAHAPDDCRADQSIAATLDFLDGFDVHARAEDITRRVMFPFWIKFAPLGADRAMHSALLGLLSDIGTSTAAAPPGVQFRERMRSLTLDHALWWHRRAPTDGWLYVDTEPQVLVGRRGFVRGSVRNEAGQLVLSFAQDTIHPRR